MRFGEVTIEGFRGANSRSLFDFNDGVTILFGDNGSGKTTVLQALEWVLTGSLSTLAGPDFTKEDAIVNMFNQKKMGTVEVCITNERAYITASRSRKIARSTSRGTSPVALKAKGKALSDERAEQYIERNLGVSADNFSRAIYLHQESIKELLSLSSKERSRALNQLLGTLELRELSESLDVKRTIASKRRILEKRIETLRRDKIQFAVNMKELVAKKKQELISSEYKESQLSLQGAVGELSSVLMDSHNLARRLGITAPKAVRPAPNIKSIVEALKELRQDSTNLDRQRTSLLRETEKKKSKLEDLRKSYVDAQGEVKSSGQLDSESAQKQESISREQLEVLDSARKTAEDRITSLVLTKAEIAGHSGNIERFETASESILKEYKSREKLEEAKQALRKTLRGLQLHSRAILFWNRWPGLQSNIFHLNILKSARFANKILTTRR